MTPREQQEREAVVAEARTWIGTPYHHAAMVKGAGVDCATLLIAVYSAVGLIESFVPEYYPLDWMMHRDEERYLGNVLRYASEVTEPLPGDAIVWKFGRSFSHGAIITDWPNILHSVRSDGYVTTGRYDDGVLADRPYKIFSLWSDKK